MVDKPHNTKPVNYAANVIRGVLMGCADVVPGVSGGTVALILRIYDRLIGAISRIDREFVSLLLRGKLVEALRHIDFWFLASLVVGILVGVVAMTLAVGRLFAEEFTRSMTLATFFGMILATGIVIGRVIRPTAAGWRPVLLAGLVGAVISVWLASLEKSAVDPSYIYLFFCGSIAICAMILPGISGAMILWILGVYRFLTAIPKELIHRENIVANLVHLGVFAAGCLLGLLAFSKVMRYFLAHHRQMTLATLCGFIVGALRALWPFQRDMTPEAAVRHKRFEPFWPGLEDGLGYVLFAAVAGFALVLIADRMAQRIHAKQVSAESEE